MTYFCVYPIGSNAIRLHNPALRKTTAQWKKNSSVEDVLEGARNVFSVINRNLLSIVLVNSLQYPPDYINAIVELSKIYTREVIVISSLQARLLFALDSIKAPLDLRQRILVAYVFDGILDVALVDGDEVLDHCYTGDVVFNDGMLHKQQQATKAARVVIVCSKQYEISCYKMADGLKNANVITTHVENMIFEGALIRATQKTQYLRDFAEGVLVEKMTNNEMETVTLVPRGTFIPFYKDLKLTNVDAFKIRSVDTFLIYPIRNYGAKRGKAYFHSKDNRSSYEINMSIVHNNESHLEVLDVTSANTEMPKKLRKSDTEFVIKLRAGYGSIWVNIQNELSALPNPMNELWTCDYISLKKDPLIGPAGKLDKKNHPASVIYDLYKFIGKKYKYIQNDPNWKIKVLPDDSDASRSCVDGPSCMFEVIIHNEERYINPITCMAMFLMALKRLAQDQLEVAVERIVIHLNEGDYHADQMSAIAEAASIADMTVTDIQIVDFGC